MLGYHDGGVKALAGLSGYTHVVEDFGNHGNGSAFDGWGIICNCNWSSFIPDYSVSVWSSVSVIASEQRID